MSRTDGVVESFSEFLTSLTPEQRESLAVILKDPRTYIAEDMSDVLAILREIES